GGLSANPMGARDVHRQHHRPRVRRVPRLSPFPRRTMPRTAIYARKSTESDDRQVASIESQLHWAVKRCGELGHRAPLILTESQSAKIPGRPEFARMVALIEK